MKYWRSKEYYASSSWKGTKKFDGGGALINQGIHGVDLLEYIMGPIKDVEGKIRTLSHAIEVEDTAVALLEFVSGALGVIVASTCAYPGFDRKMEIHGDKGYVILEENRIVKMMLDDVKTKIKIEESVSTASDPATMPSFLHELQIKNLLGALQGKESLLVDHYEGKKAVRLINAIYRSSN
jgi:predicted dehydrogenase